MSVRIDGIRGRVGGRHRRTWLVDLGESASTVGGVELSRMTGEGRLGCFNSWLGSVLITVRVHVDGNLPGDAYNGTQAKFGSKLNRSMPSSSPYFTSDIAPRAPIIVVVVVVVDWVEITLVHTVPPSDVWVDAHEGNNSSLGTNACFDHLRSRRT